MTEETSAPRTPIWTPNPGVPILARVFSYLLLALLLLATLKTMFTHRAPDLPPDPLAWTTLRVGNCVIPHPVDWLVFTDEKENGTAISITLSRANTVAFEGMVLKLPAEMNAEIETKLQEVFTKSLPERFSNYEQSETPLLCGTADATIYTFTDDETPMTGAWIVLGHGAHALLLNGFTPTEGWPTMQLIMQKMATEASWQ